MICKTTTLKDLGNCWNATRFFGRCMECNLYTNCKYPERVSGMTQLGDDAKKLLSSAILALQAIHQINTIAKELKEKHSISDRGIQRIFQEITINDEGYSIAKDGVDLRKKFV